MSTYHVWCVSVSCRCRCLCLCIIDVLFFSCNSTNPFQFTILIHVFANYDTWFVLFRSCSDIQNLTRFTCHSDCNKSTSQASLFLCPGSTNTRIGTRNIVSRSFYSADASTYNGITVQSPTHAAEEKVGVLLLNLGGPETLDDVQPFLFNLFADPVC